MSHWGGGKQPWFKDFSVSGANLSKVQFAEETQITVSDRTGGRQQPKYPALQTGCPFGFHTKLYTSG